MTNSVDWEFSKIWGTVDEMFIVDTKLPPMKSFPSLGPTLPCSNPLNLDPGMLSLSDNLILSPPKKRIFKKKDVFKIFLSKYSK